MVLDDVDGAGHRVLSQAGLYSQRYQTRRAYNERGYFHIAHIKAFSASFFDISYYTRTLRLQNFLFDPEGHIRLSDFGLAYVVISFDIISS